MATTCPHAAKPHSLAIVLPSRRVAATECVEGLAAILILGLFVHRQNEMGTPYRVLADEGLLESGVVRLQDRDTTIQVCT